MQVGIIGPLGSGKSTLFHCLTGVKSGISGKVEIVRGVAEVPDERLALVAKIFASQKITHSTVEYLDAPPLETGGLTKESFRQSFLRGLEQTDALLLVVPCFLPEQSPRVKKSVQDIETDFILCDLEGVENRLKRIAHDLLRGVRGDIERESEILEKCKATLEAENPLRNAKFREEEIKRLRGFTFLSLKPLIIILNIGEGDIADCAGLAQKAGLSEAIAICAQMEAEINDLAPEDRPAFLKEIGIGECARDKILKKTREKLELITFFTANEKEAKAWDLKRGLPALKAAGAVHTDMEWGFIRAEAIHFADLQAHPSVHDLRSLGLIHLEGKEYVVQEGDVLLFRFSG